MFKFSSDVIVYDKNEYRDIIKSVIWKIEHIESGEFTLGSVDLPDIISSDFIQFENLTNQKIEEWVSNHQDLESVKLELLDRIAAKSNEVIYTRKTIV